MPPKDSPEDHSNISEGPQLADTRVSDQKSCHDDCCANEELGAQEIEIIVGECIPDGAGGCQRSRGRETSCCTSNSDRAIAGPCCAEVTEDEKCCSDCGAETEEDECCSDCAPAIKDECCSDCGTPPKDNTCCSDHASALEDDCKDDCCAGASSPPSGSESCCAKPDPALQIADEKKCCEDDGCSKPTVRRRIIHRNACEKESTGHSHAKVRPSHHNAHTQCGMGNTFGRFFEAACCCLIDWSHKAPRAGHHHHAKKESPSIVLKKGAIRTFTRAEGSSSVDETLLERGGSEIRNLVLSVHGMDCPSCASKLTKALLTLPSVTNVKVNSFTDQATLMYKEGMVLPEAVAKRASELTGFTCAVLQEVRVEGNCKTMRVVVPDKDVSWEKTNLPPSVTVMAMRRQQTMNVLEIQYDATVIQPRAVLAAFAPWEASFLPTPKPKASDQAAEELIALLRRTLASASLCIPVLVFAWAPLPARPNVYGGCSLALATLIQSFIAAPLYSSALRSLFYQRLIDMDLLVVLSSSIAYIFSAVAFLMQVAGKPFSESFFETPTLLITLIIFGRLISAYARRRATSSLDDIRALQAETVDLVGSDGSIATISAELVHKDDVLRVLPDTLIPTDGVVLRGTSQVNESSITGESMPVQKSEGCKLTAGTLNQSGVLEMGVERVPSDNTVSDIGRLLLEVQDSRLPVQDLADRVASYLAPVILAIAVIVFCVWIAVGIRVRSQDSSTAGIAALRYSISVLVISCPCALVLCVPMVVVISAAVSAKEGVLFKSVKAVQYGKNAQVVVFDKTGTLTTGNLSAVQAHIPPDASISLILGLVSSSRHPVAQAVAEYLQVTYPDVPQVQLTDMKEIPGEGIEAQHGQLLIRGGNPTWLMITEDPSIQDLQRKALTLFAVTAGQSLVATFGLADTVRPSARAAIQFLKQRKADVYIVSGDEQSVVSALAEKLGVDPDHAIGECRPQAKQERVRALQTASAIKGRAKNGAVMFVGDGTNDSLALAQADIGVSLSSGTDIALSAADVVILDSDTADLARSLQTIFSISQGAVHRIMVNFAWAFVYNTVAVLFAAGAFVRVRVAPQYAGLGEMISVVPVVLVAWSMWLLRR